MTSEFAAAVRAGLTAVPKSIPCRFIYDANGSRLFEEICELPEYYLTRAEQEILDARAGEIAARFPADLSMVELGSGSARKTRTLIEAFLRRHGRLRYVPVDISASILEESAAALRGDYPALEIVPIAGEYREGLRQLKRERATPTLVLFLGSTIGSFTRESARAFVAGIRELLTPEDRLLMGADLRKDRETLEAAYDDAAGVTARFNLNLLERINRELDGTFDLEAFEHQAVYDEAHGRVSMYLVSTRAQTVEVDGIRVSFERGEKIHTEHSHKFTFEEIDRTAAGFRVAEHWLDGAERFSLNLLAPA